MPLDTLRIEARGRGGSGSGTGDVFANFEDWTGFSLRTSIVEPAELSLELGDDTGWDRLNELIQLGSEFQVYLGDRPRLRGRVECLDSPADAKQGATQRVVIRTKMSDAIYHSAPQGIRLKGVSLKEFVLACYAAVGITEADFDFRGDVSRDLMTGVGSRGGRPPRALEELRQEQAKVQPTESVAAAVDRHLRRHGFLHWDGPDGKIVVAAPDDQQDPIYFLQLYKESNLAQLNNVKTVQRTFDVGQAPTHLGVFGAGGKVDFGKAKIGAVVFNPDLIAAGFQRRVVILDEGLKSRDVATHRANFEFAQRNRGLERLVVGTDGLSYREGSTLIPYAPDTVADAVSALHGGALGAFFVESTQLTRSVSDGDNSTLLMVRQGVWVL
jgi:prophage tail gpP-like protein